MVEKISPGKSGHPPKQQKCPSKDAFCPILEAHDFETQLATGTEDELTGEKLSCTHRSKGSSWAHPAPAEINE